MAPPLSVIMSAYNSSGTIKRAINSILRQSFTDFELIVINDGSTDDTENQILSLSDERIRYYSLDHAGLTKALNFGLLQARGNIVARHDADDWSESERFAIQMRGFTEDDECDLIATWHNVVNIDGSYLGQKRTPLDHVALKKMLRWRNPFCHGSVSVRKSAINKVGGYNESLLYSQDYDLWVRLDANGAKFSCVPEALYNYSISPDSIAKGWLKLDKQKDLRSNALLPANQRKYAITELSSMGKRRSDSLWYYAIGSLALDDGRRRSACLHFLRSLVRDPINWRALVKLGMAFLPRSVGEMLFNRVKTRISSKPD